MTRKFCLNVIRGVCQLTIHRIASIIERITQQGVIVTMTVGDGAGIGTRINPSHSDSFFWSIEGIDTNSLNT